MTVIKEQTGKTTWLASIGPPLARGAAGLALLVGALACLASLILALYETRQPFAGFVLEPNLVISGIGRPAWPARSAGLDYPWRVVAADERALSRAADLRDYLWALPPGTPVTYTVEDPAGQQQVWPEAISTKRLPPTDALLLFWIPYLSALAYLVGGAWIYRSHRREPQGHACAILCAGMAVALSLFFDAFYGHYLTRLWIVALPLSGAAAIHLGIAFPAPPRRCNWLGWTSYLPAVALIGWGQATFISPDNPHAHMPAWRWTYIFISMGIVFLLGRLLHTRYASPNSHRRQQARSLLLGSLLAFLPTAIGLGSSAFGFDFSPYLPLIYLSLAIFPFTLAYAVARERLLDVDRVVGRGLAYSLMAVLLAGLYIAMAGLIGWLAPGLMRADDPLVLAFMVIVAALLVSPLQRHLRRLVDRLLYRERFNFRRIVQAFGQSLAQVIDLPELSQLILHRIADVLHLDAASLYLFDPRSGTYTLYQALDQTDPAQAPAFAETDPFIRHLRAARGAVYRHHPKGNWLNQLPPEETARVNRLFALVFLPLATKSHLVGWLNLGARLSGEGYSGEDLELLNALADRAAVAVENARLFAERERRLTELAVLNEIGQAINSALSLRQVLETIYRETGRLMDTTNFYIALHNPDREEVTFPLFVEDGVPSCPPPRRQGKGLTEYILQTQQPLLIAERVEETIRDLGMEVVGRPATSWLGVPILHEGQAIGVIALQSTTPEVSYDVEDLAILTAIANQAAIAIENARLYEVTDQALAQRMEENDILTDFVRTLAAVALDPHQVAEHTLCRTMETLQASRGILLRYDETADSFTPLARLRWASDEGWSELRHKLLPDLLAGGTRALIQRPGLGTHAPEEAATVQLICPLIREDALLALLHLQLPADQEPDQERRRFLRHLANHAAIALENALLYQQQFDQRQALDHRARQLTDILNLSNALQADMELDQVLQFVVEAVRDTLGFRIALLSLMGQEEAGRARRIVAVGLDPETFCHLQAHRPSLAFYQQLMRPQFRISRSYLIGPEDTAIWDEIKTGSGGGYVPELGPRQPGEWNEGCGLFIPLRGAEERLLGVLSVDDPVDRQIPDRNTIEILEIFANQAAIAIENARLYQALREAYEAKSEFLSIVAHELRVPMGAIWGYTELLSREAAVENSASQQSFLQIIKANIARLDALVNDLLDVSHIESGKTKLALTPLNPEEIVLESVNNARPQVERKGLTLTLDLPEHLPTIQADHGRLVQVLDNILSNAWKYTPAPGSIKVTARSLQRAEDLNGVDPGQRAIRCPCVLISIEDTGIGLSAQEKKRLFTRFFRSDHPLVRQESGTGLGLYLVRLLVEAHGGQVWVHSEPGRGSTFHVALPLARTKQSVSVPYIE